jgi:hypothetical protein
VAWLVDPGLAAGFLNGEDVLVQVQVEYSVLSPVFLILQSNGYLLMNMNQGCGITGLHGIRFLLIFLHYLLVLFSVTDR